MAETINFLDLTKKTDDLFELITAAAKRAKQINALRIAKNPLPTIGKDEEESFDETPEDDPLVNWDAVEKPATAAINELLADSIDYKFASIEEDSKEENEEK